MQFHWDHLRICLKTKKSNYLVGLWSTLPSEWCLCLPDEPPLFLCMRGLCGLVAMMANSVSQFWADWWSPSPLHLSIECMWLIGAFSLMMGFTPVSILRTWQGLGTVPLERKNKCEKWTFDHAGQMCFLYRIIGTVYINKSRTKCRQSINSYLQYFLSIH